MSAAFGGTTTVMPFCAQHRGDPIPAVLADYAARARTKAVIDYAFHLIVANPDEATLERDLPAAIAQGIRSFKIYMTYERLHVTDEQILDVMAVARRHGALVMVHAENHGVISWLAGRMIDQGNIAPRYHAICHTRGSEHEAIQRVAMLAELIDVPILIVHVSTIDGIEAIRQARARGVKIYGETCPQYLFLTAQGPRPARGSKARCSAAARRRATRRRSRHAGAGLKDGALERVLVRSRAVPLRRDRQAAERRAKTTFKEMANGVPGIELRLPLAVHVRLSRRAPYAAGVRRLDRDAACADLRLLSAARERSQSDRMPTSRSGIRNGGSPSRRVSSTTIPATRRTPGAS